MPPDLTNRVGRFIPICRERNFVRRPLTIPIIAALLLTVVGSCSRKAVDATPEGAVRELLDRIARAESDPAQVHAVYELLSSRTRVNLEERARRATAATGHEVRPYEMLAPGRFSVHFDPVHMHSRIVGERAMVDVVGIDPEADHAAVPCVMEEERWRIEIPLPSTVPLDHRPEP